DCDSNHPGKIGNRLDSAPNPLARASSSPGLIVRDRTDLTMLQRLSHSLMDSKTWSDAGNVPPGSTDEPSPLPGSKTLARLSPDRQTASSISPELLETAHRPACDLSLSAAYRRCEWKSR